MKKTENPNNLQFRKNFIWNLTGTTINTLTSLVYMIIATRINGLDQAGVFSFAFSNALPADRRFAFREARER